MTDTPAESAEAPRTPGQIARVYSDGCMHEWSRTDGACVGCVAAAVGAALAARDAEWVEAVTETFGRLAVEMIMAGTAANSGALRALLSEGKRGQ